MSEGSRTYQGSYTDAGGAAPTMKTKLKEVAVPFIRLAKAVDRAIPNIRTADGMAYALAKRTPRTLAICMTLLFAGVIASRLNVWSEGYLWGIPSLGAISMGVGFWVWSSNMLLRPDISPEARFALKRAVRLQLTIVVAGALAMVYFVGMALGLW